jgi:hypothetical protein
VASTVDARAEAHRSRQLAPHLHRRRRIATREHDCELFELVGQLGLTRWIHVADLEQLDACAPMRFVERDCLQQTGAQGGAQHALLGHERIDDSKRRAGDAGACQVRRRPRTGWASPR